MLAKYSILAAKPTASVEDKALIPGTFKRLAIAVERREAAQPSRKMLPI